MRSHAETFRIPVRQHGGASVTITHHGRPTGTLRGGRAEKFLAEVESGTRNR